MCRILKFLQIWQNFWFLHICCVKNLKFLYTWRNFRFLHICHVLKSEISPHDQFFLHLYIGDRGDKYEVWGHLFKTETICPGHCYFDLWYFMIVFNASSLELLFRPPIHLFCVTPLQRPGNPCSFPSSCVIFNRCCRNVKEQNEKSKGRHVIILCHPPSLQTKYRN